jgi:hypothetical protein
MMKNKTWRKTDDAVFFFFGNCDMRFNRIEWEGGGGAVHVWMYHDVIYVTDPQFWVAPGCDMMDPG